MFGRRRGGADTQRCRRRENRYCLRISVGIGADLPHAVRPSRKSVSDSSAKVHKKSETTLFYFLKFLKSPPAPNLPLPEPLPHSPLRARPVSPLFVPNLSALCSSVSLSEPLPPCRNHPSGRAAGSSHARPLLHILTLAQGIFLLKRLQLPRNYCNFAHYMACTAENTFLKLNHNLKT